MKCGDRDWGAETVGVVIGVTLIVYSVIGLWGLYVQGH